jgi:hypothetical protein
MLTNDEEYFEFLIVFDLLGAKRFFHDLIHGVQSIASAKIKPKNAKI